MWLYLIGLELVGYMGRRDEGLAGDEKRAGVNRREACVSCDARWMESRDEPPFARCRSRIGLVVKNKRPG